MLDSPEYVIDAKVHEALSKYFHGVTLKKIVGDCSVLTGIRKQNGAQVEILVPSYAASRDDATPGEISKQFLAYEKLNRRDLQAAVRCFTSGAFRKSPALAVLRCPVDVIDDAFDTQEPSVRLEQYIEVLEAISALHEAKIVHGAISHKAVRREEARGPIRLCDIGFSGGRKTTVVEQPIVYQSRNVINSSQPDLVDDVYAAGMLGYRFLLGQYGPEQVLTGKSAVAETERLAAAILGEDRETPDARQLFPQGHKSAEQIARVLARMIGRLPNAEPYSSATAALKAMRSVIENPASIAVEGRVRPKARSYQSSGSELAGANSRKSPELSRVAMITMVCSTLSAMFAASYFHLRAERIDEGYSVAVFQLKELRATLDSVRRENSALEDSVAGIVETANELRVAEAAVVSADLTGARTASDKSAGALERAENARVVAIEAFNSHDWPRVGSASDVAKKEAESAITAAAEILTMASAAHDRASLALLAAERAAGRATSIPLELRDRFEQAQFDHSARNYQDAAMTWNAVSDELEQIVSQYREKAAEARNVAKDLNDRLGTSAEAAAVRGIWLTGRADQAFSAGAYAEAEAVYRRAEHTFLSADNGDLMTSAASIGLGKAFIQANASGLKVGKSSRQAKTAGW